MLKIKFLSLVIVLNLFACTFAGLVDNGSKQLNSKGDAESSSNSKKEDKNRFAAPLNELENARTHFSKPFLKPFIGGGSGHQQGYPLISSLIPQIPHKPFNIIHPPVAPVAPVTSLYVEPSKPVAPIFPQIFSQPIVSKPHLPIASKPTFVVSQQVIHKPVVTEKIEIIRRPVYSEVVEVVHKPILSEVQQVIKHPTYVEHVVKKPLVTAIKNEFQGSPVHLPSQQYELHDKPQHVQPVTTEVVQIPHQQVPVGSGYGFDSGYKPSYGVSGPVVTGSYGIGSEIVGLGSSPSYVSGYGPSYGLGSGYGSTYGLGSGYGSSYGLGSGYGSSYGSGSGYGSSYGLGSGYGPSYVLGSGYGSSYGLGSGQSSTYGLGSGYGSSYGLGTGYGSSYGLGSGYGSSYGSNYVKPSYGQESTGVEHTYVEPATSCKNNECKPVLSEDDLSLNENLEAVYSPTSWYYASSHLDNGRNVYEQGASPSPGYYYIVPQETSEEPQNSKLDDFMNNPSTKVKVEALYNEFRQTIANDKQSVGQSREVAGNDDRNGIMEEDTKKQMMNMAEDEKVEQVVHTVKTANGPMLEKIEEQIRKRQSEIEKSESKLESSSTQDAMQTQTTKMN